MLDRIFAPALAFLVLAGATLMIALATFADLRTEPESTLVSPDPALMLEPVTITGPRIVRQGAAEPEAGPQQAQVERTAAPEGRSVLLHRSHE